jgi:tetratricopeptide (TPR) repeat protein
MNVEAIPVAMEKGLAYKRTGNEAFARNERKVALDAYEEAIGYFLDILGFKPEFKDEMDARKNLAICYANSAACWSLDGDGMNPKKAIEDGERAEEWDEDYAKAYVFGYLFATQANVSFFAVISAKRKRIPS